MVHAAQTSLLFNLVSTLDKLGTPCACGANLALVKVGLDLGQIWNSFRILVKMAQDLAPVVASVVPDGHRVGGDGRRTPLGKM